MAKTSADVRQEQIVFHISVAVLLREILEIICRLEMPILRLTQKYSLLFIR